MVSNLPSVQAAMALLLWPFLVFYFFRRFPIAQAALYSFLGSIFLPELAFVKPSLMPVLDKYTLTYVSMFLAVFPRRRKALGTVAPWIYLTFLGSFAAGIMVWYTNQETLFYGPTVISGLNMKDGMFLFISTMIGTPLVTWLGMKCFHDERDLIKCVTAITAVGLINGVMALIEVRMSPQLHNWIYGYPVGDYLAAQRHGGYRPLNLMVNGLALAMVLLGALMTACLLARTRRRVWKVSGKQAMWFMVVVVILDKSTAVWLYALVAVPLLMRAKPKTIAHVAVVLIVLVGLYPWMRATGIFPVDAILDFAGKFGAERAQSMEFRFRNEEMLLKHSLQKPWFGWSTNYGRGFVFSTITGLPESVPDGGWILAMMHSGICGLVGYLAVPAFAVILVARRLRRIPDPKHQLMLAGMALYLAICWVDILPNASFTLWPQFLSGVLTSVSFNMVEKAKQAKRSARAQAAMPAPPQAAPDAVPVPG